MPRDLKPVSLNCSQSSINNNECVFIFLLGEKVTVLHSIPVDCRRELKAGEVTQSRTNGLIELIELFTEIKDNSYDECKSNCSPPTNQCPVSLLVVEEIDMKFYPLQNSFHNMSYSMEYPLASLSQLS